MKKAQLAGVLLVYLAAGSPSIFAQGSQQSPTGDQMMQAPAGQHRSGAEGQGIRELIQNAISGSVQSVTADSLTVKKMDGTTVTVKTNKETMFGRERQESKISDFKVGDAVIVAGDPAGENTVMAKFVAMRPTGPNAMNPEDLGKKFIFGEVLKIEETKLTIKRPDGVEQVIEVDEDTSFKNSKRESVTLADVKVGDHVRGRGALKAGTFVPAELIVGMPQRESFRMQHDGSMTGPQPEGPPPSSAPNTPNNTVPKQDF